MVILPLYSKEATAITKELDIKKCDSAINAIRKRLLKHCESKEDQVSLNVNSYKIHAVLRRL